MNTSSPTTGRHDNKAPKHRRKWRVVGAVAAVLATGALLFASGFPQKRLAEYAIRRATGLSARVEGLSLYPRVHIERLDVFTGIPEAPPALRVQNLAIEYTAFPDTGRWIRHVSAEHIRLHLDSALTARLQHTPSAEPARAPALTFVPEKVSFPAIETRLELPSIEAQAAGIAMSLDIASLEELQFVLRSDALTGHAHLPLSDFATSLDGGTLHIAGRRDGPAFALETCRASLPNLAEIDSAARVSLELGVAQFALEVPAFRILGVGEKTVFLPGTDLPVTIGAFTATDLLAEGMYFYESGRIVPSTARISGRATHIRLGEEDTAWHLDAAEFHAEGELPAFDLRLVLNEDLPLDMQISYDEDSATATVSASDWQRDALDYLLPARYAAYLDMLPAMQGVSAQAEAFLNHPAFEVTGTLTPDFGADAGFAAAPIQVHARGTLDEPMTCTGEAILPVEGGTLTAVFALEPPEPIGVRFALETVDAARLAALTQWGPLPEFAARIVSGSVDTVWTGGGIDVEARIEGAPGPWGTELLHPSEVSAEASFRYNTGTGDIEGRAFSMTTGEHLTATSRGWRLRLEPLEFDGIVTGRVEPERVSPWAEELNFAADARFTLPLTLREGRVALSWDAESDYVRLGDYSLFDAPVRTTGQATIGLDDYAGTFEEFVLQYGETSTLTLAAGTVAFDPFHLEGPYAFRSQMRLLVDAGLLDAVEGLAEGTGEILWQERLELTCDYRVEAPLLVTADSALALGGILMEGNLRMDTSVNGRGQLHVAECAVAGVPLRNIVGPVIFEGDSIRLEHFTSELFEGIARGTVALHMGGDSTVITTTVQLRNIDLAQFAATMLPPEYAIRGRAQGRVAATLTPEGLDDATLKLVSSSDFAINKALLQNALLQYLRGMRGGQTIERISADVLGTGDWRPFDSATLDLEWIKDSMAGDAYLRSVNLNLQIDLNVDEESMRQILALQQQALIENIENIRTEPVQQ